jgi:hypothetical protein
MCGGGAPKDRSVELQQVKFQQEQELARQEREREAAELAAFQERLGSAVEGARSNAFNQAEMQGFDVGELTPYIDNTIRSIQSTVPTGSENPNSFFNGTLEGALAAATGARRGQFNRQISSFAPTGFEDNLILDTMDDNAINSILDTEFGKAKTFVDNAAARGVLGNQGITAALRNLNEQRSGINFNLQDLGGGILEEGRSSIANIANKARSGASAYNFGEQFDPFSFSTQINNRVADFTGSLGDALRSRAGSDLFDTSNLLNIGGAAQGGQNFKLPATNSQSSTNPTDKDRGLGTTGVF